MVRPINRASDMKIMKLIERYDSDDKCRLTLENPRWRWACAVSAASRKWFIAIYLICKSKKASSALQLKRTLGVAYKTA